MRFLYSDTAATGALRTTALSECSGHVRACLMTTSQAQAAARFVNHTANTARTTWAKNRNREGARLLDNDVGGAGEGVEEGGHHVVPVLQHRLLVVLQQNLR